MPSLRYASRSEAGGAFFSTKPPLEPTGTMTVFFTICAFTRPRTSVRKSSGRSDQRKAAAHLAPAQVDAFEARRVSTKIPVASGLGSGRPGTRADSNLKLR